MEGVDIIYTTQICPFSKSKFNLESDCVNLVPLASPIECLLYLPNVRAIQYKLGPERLTRLGNSNILMLPVILPLLRFYIFLIHFLFRLILSFFLMLAFLFHFPLNHSFPSLYIYFPFLDRFRFSFFLYFFLTLAFRFRIYS